MSYSNDELKSLWANNEKRRDFTKLYKDWGVYASTPEFNLTYYKYVLPDGSQLFVMEYMQENYSILAGEPGWHLSTRVYLQKGEYFMPNPVNGYEINEHLKNLKKMLLAKKADVEA